MNSTDAKRPSGTTFDQVSAEKLPTFPTPWVSADAGETWVWGDFVMFLQKRPITMVEQMAKMAGKSLGEVGLVYHYVMTVFYRMNRNPHGLSLAPIMAATMEQSDNTVTARRLGLKAPLDGGGMSPVYLGLFNADGHANLGTYDGIITAETAKKEFFRILQGPLGLTGQPKLIGTIDQAFGHPETGMPRKSSGKTGCGVLLFLGTGLAGLAAWGLSFI